VRHKGDGEGFLEAVRKHLFVVEANGGEPKQITDGDWDDVEPAWSPDASLIAFTSTRERDRDLTLLNDVFVVPSAGGRARRLTRHKGQVGTPVFSPDGTQVAYLGHERGWTYGARTELLTVPTTGGDSRAVCEGFDAEVANSALSDARDPFAALPPTWEPDGRGLLALVSRFGRVEIVRFGLDGAEPQTVVGGDREVSAFSIAGDGRRIAGIVSDPTHPYEVYAFDGESERRLSGENNALLEEIELACAESVSFVSSDGQTVHGWLMKPPGFSERKKWPLVLEVHGGPETMYAWSFMHEFQVLAARGYAVLYTNPRGSKGYGEAFTARIFADWGNQDAADCMAAVDFVAGQRWVDRERLGLTGGSYGGFMTAWLVGHTERFRAAVSQRGCYNFSSFYGTSDIGPWFGEYVLGGPVYERPALYAERSPLTYAPAMRTPLLLIHSEQDLRCPIEQAEQLFVQLRRIGKCEVEMVRFPEESHNLSRSGRPDRRVERLERIVGWFDRHMRTT
jgi:dipeptidyl aminopeptidase/acylaminoacyl peptidase